jgi:hypothetical protein
MDINSLQDAVVAAGGEPFAQRTADMTRLRDYDSDGCGIRCCQ